MQPDELRAKLARVKSASLADAVHLRHGHRAHVLDLVTPTPGRVLFGPAATMLFAPRRADADAEASGFEAQLARALDGAPPGAVVAMACGSLPDAAVAGGVRLAALARHGCAGLLTDARMRDFEEARALDLACWCRGETPRAGSLDAMPVATGVPVPLGGATVVPGDFLYADAAGAVVIPGADVAGALDAAIEIEARDAERVRKARGG